MCFLPFLILTLNPLQQAIEAVRLSWAFRENCLSVLCEFFRGMITVLFQWEPRFSGAQLLWRPFLATLLGCSKRVARQRGETRNASVSTSRKY